MTKQELFMAGIPFTGGRLIFTQFRYNSEADHIEMQAFHPISDQWLYYCKAECISSIGFAASILLLGQQLVVQGFLFKDLEFSPVVSQEGGCDVGV
jgi:hypothetical protein